MPANNRPDSLLDIIFEEKNKPSKEAWDRLLSGIPTTSDKEIKENAQAPRQNSA